MATDAAPEPDEQTEELIADEDGVIVRPFADFLREQGKGQLHEELSQALHTLVGAVNDTSKKGTLTLQLTLQPMKGNPDVLTMTDVVKLVVPKPERRPSIFYADDNGNLTKTDPNQPQLSGLKIAGKKPGKTGDDK